MVLGQLLGLITAAPAGELSGAGFGPNYTILMKLGFEHYAPRILEEMEKTPEMDFQQTKYFKLFQGHLKNYTDKKLEQTFDSLLKIPLQQIDKIMDKFTDAIIPGRNTTTETSALELGSGLTQVRFPSQDLQESIRSDGSETVAEINARRNKELLRKNKEQAARLHATATTTKDKFPRTSSARHAQLNIEITKLRPKFVVGATSKRRKTQSTDNLLATLMRNSQSQIRTLLNARSESQWNYWLNAVIKMLQRILDHKFTYI